MIILYIFFQLIIVIYNNCMTNGITNKWIHLIEELKPTTFTEI